MLLTLRFVRIVYPKIIGKYILQLTKQEKKPWTKQILKYHSLKERFICLMSFRYPNLTILFLVDLRDRLNVLYRMSDEAGCSPRKSTGLDYLLCMVINQVIISPPCVFATMLRIGL